MAVEEGSTAGLADSIDCIKLVYGRYNAVAGDGDFAGLGVEGNGDVTILIEHEVNVEVGAVQSVPYSVGSVAFDELYNLDSVDAVSSGNSGNGDGVGAVLSLFHGVSVGIGSPTGAQPVGGAGENINVLSRSRLGGGLNNSRLSRSGLCGNRLGGLSRCGLCGNRLGRLIGGRLNSGGFSGSGLNVSYQQLNGGCVGNVDDAAAVHIRGSKVVLAALKLIQSALNICDVQLDDGSVGNINPTVSVYITD